MRSIAFQPCITLGGVYWVEMGQNNDFLQKSGQKTAFLRDTNLDQPTLGGSEISLTSTGVLKNLEHKLRNELWARRQTSILAESKLFEFFEKMLKNDFFHKTHSPKFALRNTYIQARSMLKLTS